MLSRQFTKQLFRIHTNNTTIGANTRILPTRYFSTQLSKILSTTPSSNNTTNTTTSSNSEEKTATSSEPVENSTTLSSVEQNDNSNIEQQQTSSTEQSNPTVESGFNLQSTASLIMDSAETLKQKREMLQKELESRKDAEVMLKKVIYRGIRAFGVLFLAVCLLIWAVKRKNLEAKVKKFNDKIKKSEEKEQELERELEANFSYIKKDIENKNASSSTTNNN